MASTHILATGKIVGGAIEMDVAVPPFMLTKHTYIEYLCSVADEPVDAPLDGELQRLIWEAEETAEYEDDIDDREFFMRGCW